jgi:protein O-GlcNAc transferase
MLADLLKQLIGRRSTPAVPGAESSERQQLLSQAEKLYRSGAHRELAAKCKTLLHRFPDDPDIAHFLAASLLAQGDSNSGLGVLQRAARAHPEHLQLHISLARVHVRLGAMDEAVACYERALSDDRFAETAAIELAGLLNRLGRYDAAEQAARTALRVAPSSSSANHLLAQSLFEQGDVDGAIELLRALAAEPNVAATVHSDLLRALNYSDLQSPRSVSRAHLEWGARHADALSVRTRPYRNSNEPDRCLRIGFVSPYFRRHAVTFFLESVIEHLCRDALEVYLYADVAQRDEYSDRLCATGAKWRDTLKCDDAALAALVEEDGIDILVDLSGHTPGNRLLAFARRPAPVQMSWNGYPNTTGMRAIDYRITDDLCDPPGTTERFHSEHLLRLPSIYMSWHPPEAAPGVDVLPARRNGYITYASFNSCYKLSTTTLRLWAQIMAAQPEARLLLATIPTEKARSRIARAFEAAAVDPRRLDFCERVSHEKFLEMHARADIALDPYPYHGTTTTCFSLWMGVPVISLAGPTHVSRVGLTVLTNVGLEDLIARNPEEYVRIAERLASDLDKLEALRAGLRQRLLSSPLADGAACAASLAAAVRRSWAAWCTEQMAVRDPTATPRV